MSLEPFLQGVIRSDSESNRKRSFFKMILQNTSRLSLSKLDLRHRRSSKPLNISGDSVKSPAKGRVHVLPVTATAPHNDTGPNDETSELSQKNGSFLQCLEGNPKSPRTKCGMKKRTLPEKIDFACRILFPLIYALYNWATGMFICRALI